MASLNVHSNLFAKDNFKCYEENNLAQYNERDLKYGLENARSILKDLERSLRKSSKYERKLFKCKQSHSHSHDSDEWWDSSPSEDRYFQREKTSKSSRSQFDLKESWSTISIVCLQYQYEELSKRYETLLQAYAERCGVLKSRDAALALLRARARKAYEKLAYAHKSILAVGHKYLELKRKRNAELTPTLVFGTEYILKCQKQKNWYVAQILSLREAVYEVMSAAERARLEFDGQLAQSMTGEKDSDAALLLTQIRKCNLLFLENLRLKAQIEDLLPSKERCDN